MLRRLEENPDVTITSVATSLGVNYKTATLWVRQSTNEKSPLLTPEIAGSCDSSTQEREDSSTDEATLPAPATPSATATEGE
jgi:transposase-like protein